VADLAPSELTGRCDFGRSPDEERPYFNRVIFDKFRLLKKKPPSLGGFLTNSIRKRELLPLLDLLNDGGFDVGLAYDFFDVLFGFFSSGVNADADAIPDFSVLFCLHVESAKTFFFQRF